MDENSQALLIAFGILSSGVFVCWCLNHYKEINTKRFKDRLDNVRKKLMFKNKIKPIIVEMTEEEFKQYEIRMPQTLAENV